MIDGSTTLSRRLERYRAATRPPPASMARVGVDDLATRLAEAVDGEVVRGSEGVIVRRETPSRPLPVDRARLALLPGQPPPDIPLVCLDTETTGLATAAGTMAFLIGLGWWEADSFRQVQLLLPDHAEERALLSALEAAIPRAAWLVTYNGRGFDWPLLTTRFRMARRAAPAHAGHLDLLPIVRRLFRHRMADARLRTAEAELLGLHRVGDVDGSEIPGRYLALPGRRPGDRAGRGRPPQRPGRAIARATDGVSRDPTRRPLCPGRGAARRPCRSGPRVRARTTTARGARLPRRRGRQAGRATASGARAYASVPTGHGQRHPPGRSQRSRGGRHVGRQITADDRAVRSSSVRHGPPSSTHPGQRNGSRSSAPICCDGSDGTAMPPMRGRC